MFVLLPKLGELEHRSVACSKTRLFAAAVIGLIASSTSAEEPIKLAPDEQTLATPAKAASEWKIQIVPGSRNPVALASHITQITFNDVEKNAVPVIEEPAPGVRRNEPRLVTPEAYREIYNSIPFSRAEYLANRDYRHEATMEILFGQLRSKTIVQIASPATETRTSYFHQSFGRPGNIAPAIWNSPMMLSPWGW
ncbi:MAG: hypothetical protein NT013_10980 [Planctomycetia bacterium]|nr:hypothetical protein [Planctomycetia bacterium]